MQSITLKRSMPILLMLFCVTRILSQETVTTPKTLSALTFPQTVAVSSGVKSTADDCEDRLATANKRLEKALDAYDKAMALVDAKDAVIAAKDGLIALQKEAMAIKDQWIADLQADNKFLRDANKPTIKSKVRKFFETVEKILLVGAGIYLGRL